MPEYVVRGYYEYSRKNLKEVRELRKQTKVLFREREVFSIACDLVVSFLILDRFVCLP